MDDVTEFGGPDRNYPMPDRWSGSNTAFEVVRNGDGRKLYQIGDANGVDVNGEDTMDDDKTLPPCN